MGKRSIFGRSGARTSATGMPRAGWLLLLMRGPGALDLLVDAPTDGALANLSFHLPF